MKKIFLILLCLLGVVVFILVVGNDKPEDLQIKANELRGYCVENGYSTDIALLVDYGGTFWEGEIFCVGF